MHVYSVGDGLVLLAPQYALPLGPAGREVLLMAIRLDCRRSC